MHAGDPTPLGRVFTCSEQDPKLGEFKMCQANHVSNHVLLERCIQVAFKHLSDMLLSATHSPPTTPPPSSRSQFTRETNGEKCSLQSPAQPGRDSRRGKSERVPHTPRQCTLRYQAGASRRWGYFLAPDYPVKVQMMTVPWAPTLRTTPQDTIHDNRH